MLQSASGVQSASGLLVGGRATRADKWLCLRGRRGTSGASRSLTGPPALSTGSTRPSAGGPGTSSRSVCCCLCACLLRSRSRRVALPWSELARPHGLLRDRLSKTRCARARALGCDRGTALASALRLSTIAGDRVRSAMIPYRKNADASFHRLRDGATLFRRLLVACFPSILTLARASIMFTSETWFVCYCALSPPTSMPGIGGGVLATLAGTL